MAVSAIAEAVTETPVQSSGVLEFREVVASSQVGAAPAPAPASIETVTAEVSASQPEPGIEATPAAVADEPVVAPPAEEVETIVEVAAAEPVAVPAAEPEPAQQSLFRPVAPAAEYILPEIKPLSRNESPAVAAEPAASETSEERHQG